MFIKHLFKFFEILLAFIIFGIGGLIFGFIYLPLAALCFKNKEDSFFFQEQIHHVYRLFVVILNKLNIFELNIIGAEKIPDIENELIIANHPSLVDVVFLLSIFPHIVCIIKPAIWRNIFMKKAVRRANYIKSNQAETLVTECQSVLAQKKGSVLIFPEGTRTLKGKTLNQFKSGFCNIAYNQDITIRPIIIKLNPCFLSKEDKWYNIPDKICRVSIIIDDGLKAKQLYLVTDSRSIAVRKIKQYMHQYFIKRINEDEPTSK